MKTVVIIPTYNEKENIEKIISLVFLYMPYSHILVVDDNSPDGTAFIVKRLQSTNPNIHLLQREKKEGLGRAYIHSFRYAMESLDPDVLVMMDADMSHPPEALPNMFSRIEEFDVIIGSRYISGGDTVGWETWRKALSKFASVYSRLITGMNINDFTAGFYMFRASLLKKIDLDYILSSGYAFQIELKSLFHRSGADFLEYPIVFKNRTGGESKMSNHIIKEGVIAPWKIRFSHFFKNKKNKERNDCPLCFSESSFWGKKNNHNLFVCSKCNLIFVNPIPKEISVYGDDYFSGALKGFGYVDYDLDKEPMIPVFNKYLDLVQKFSLYKPEKTTKKIFDVGSATGFFLDIARKRGYEVLGIEYSSFASSEARKKGIDTICGDLLDSDVVIEKESFDVVSMLDVLEHFKNPFDELKKASEILKKDGLLIINTPNGESFISKFLKTKWHLVVPPEHLFYFSPKNLKMFLESIGFEVVYSGNIGKSFTFAYIFKTLYKWLDIGIFNYLAKFFSKDRFKNWSIKLNLYDNFFLIARKK